MKDILCKCGDTFQRASHTSRQVKCDKCVFAEYDRDTSLIVPKEKVKSTLTCPTCKFRYSPRKRKCPVCR